MSDVVGSGSGDTAAPLAKKAKTEHVETINGENVKDKPTAPISSFKKCCRLYVLDKYAIISYKKESDWTQLECSSGSECPRKLPKVTQPVEKLNEVKTEPPEPAPNVENVIPPQPPLPSSMSSSETSNKATLEASISINSPVVTLKSSLSASNVCHAGTSAATVTTTKSVSFNLPPDHKEDRSSLGNVKSKTNKKMGQKLDYQAEETTSMVDNQNEADDFVRMKTMEPPKLPNQAPSIHTLGAPPPLPYYPQMNKSIPNMNSPPGFPPYPDPAQFANHVSGPNFPPHMLGTTMIAHGTGPQTYLNNPGFNGPVPMHHAVPPNYPHAGTFLGGRPRPQPAVTEQTVPGPTTYASQSSPRFPSVPVMEESISTKPMYTKGPEFHQHLHSHLHQHMHYPPTGSTNNGPNMGSVNSSAKMSQLLTMAVQPKGKWCGAHGKIAFYIHAKKREKQDLVPNTTGALVSLQPSKNSPFSKVSGSTLKQSTSSSPNASSVANRIPPEHQITTEPAATASLSNASIITNTSSSAQNSQLLPQVEPTPI